MNPYRIAAAAILAFGLTEVAAFAISDTNRLSMGVSASTSNLTVAGTITFNGVSRTTWPTGTDLTGYMNGTQGTQSWIEVADTNTFASASKTNLVEGLGATLAVSPNASGLIITNLSRLEVDEIHGFADGVTFLPGNISVPGQDINAGEFRIYGIVTNTLGGSDKDFTIFHANGPEPRFVFPYGVYLTLAEYPNVHGLPDNEGQRVLSSNQVVAVADSRTNTFTNSTQPAGKVTISGRSVDIGTNQTGGSSSAITFSNDTVRGMVLYSNIFTGVWAPVDDPDIPAGNLTNLHFASASETNCIQLVNGSGWTLHWTTNGVMLAPSSFIENVLQGHYGIITNIITQATNVTYTVHFEQLFGTGRNRHASSQGAAFGGLVVAPAVIGPFRNYAMYSVGGVMSRQMGLAATSTADGAGNETLIPVGWTTTTGIDQQIAGLDQFDVLMQATYTKDNSNLVYRMAKAVDGEKPVWSSEATLTNVPPVITPGFLGEDQNWGCQVRVRRITINIP